MKTTTLTKALGRKTTLALAIPLLMAAQAQGFEFSMGQLDAQVDSQLNMGSSWRTQSAASELTQNVAGLEGNGDDGNKNFQSGDAFSQVLTGNHKLKFSFDNYGGVVSGKYWYDSALANNSVTHGHGATLDTNGQVGSASYTHQNEKLDDSNFDDLSKAQGAFLMDAYVYGEFEMGEMPLDVRVGRQVLSWGESTFKPGALSNTNPMDVAALRRPGAEIKDALLPVSMAYANLGLSDDTSLEAFYQLEYEASNTPACGTYFATNDYASNGCDTMLMNGGAVTLTRHDDGYREAKDDGQFGAALRFNVGDTEVGLYAMNVHSRLPTISFTNTHKPNAQVEAEITGVATAGVSAQVLPVATPLVTQQVTAGVTQQVTAGVYAQYGISESNPLESQDAGTQALIAGTIDAGVAAQADTIDALVTAELDDQVTTATDAYLLDPTNYQNTRAYVLTQDSYYVVENHEDQQIVGLSFATTVGPVALSGELTHTKDSILQINGPQMLDAVVSLTSDSQELLDIINSTELGGVIETYKKHDVSQLQFTGITTFDQVAGASTISLVGEVAFTSVHDFDEGDDATKYGRSDLFGAYYANDNSGSIAATDDGFLTQNSWGYNARLSAQYPNAIAGINLTPTLSWKHDVEGYSQFGFVEGDTKLGLSVLASYQETYTAELSYTQYAGGDYSMLKDRDFASISMGMQF